MGVDVSTVHNCIFGCCLLMCKVIFVAVQCSLWPWSVVQRTALGYGVVAFVAEQCLWSWHRLFQRPVNYSS